MNKLFIQFKSFFSFAANRAFPVVGQILEQCAFFIFIVNITADSADVLRHFIATSYRIQIIKKYRTESISKKNKLGCFINVVGSIRLIGESVRN